MGTALKTFKKAHSRAEHLVELADGLKNTRKRNMRSDWAVNFRKLMHWNADSSFDRVDGQDVIVIIKDSASLSKNSFDPLGLGDLYRAALIMAVSAMDAYFHAKVLHYVVSQSKKTNASKSLLNTKIMVEDFVRGNQMKRRNTALRSALERHLSYQSLQIPEKIARALNLLGVDDFWKKVARKMLNKKNDPSGRIKEIVKRRNQIAHEGDLSQSKKTRNRDREIKPKFVRESSNFIRDFVEKSEEVINDVVKPRR